MKHQASILGLLVFLIGNPIFSQVIEFSVDTFYWNDTITIVTKKVVRLHEHSPVDWETSTLVRMIDGVMFNRYSTINRVKNGVFESYYSNSVTKEVCIYNNGFKVGRQIKYHPNGKRKSLGFFYENVTDSVLSIKEHEYEAIDDYGEDVIGIIYSYPSVKVGNWWFWDENGNCLKVEKWDMDVLINVKIFD